MDRATSPWRLANTSGTWLSAPCPSSHQHAAWIAIRPSRSIRRRCIAGTSASAGVSSPCGRYGASAQRSHWLRSLRPGAQAAQSTMENSII